MAGFFASSFFWGNVVGKAIETATSQICSDGTLPNKCSELNPGKKCAYLPPKEDCLEINKKIKCRKLPSAYELVPSEDCQ